MTFLLRFLPANFENGHLYMFLFSIFAAVVILTVYGMKHKLPFPPWFLIVFFTFFFAIIGGKLFSYSFSDWQEIIKTFEFPVTQQKRLLGYFVFGLIGFLATKRFLRFKHKVGDAFAFAWPVALIITRIACLMGGCCYGTPTKLPFGITYPQGSSAFAAHQHAGLLETGALNSLPVHPVPLYEILFCFFLLVGLFLVYKSHWLKNRENLFYLSLGFYGVFRFFEEFIRPSGDFIWGLKTTQLFVLALSAFMFVIVFIREKKPLQLQFTYDLQKHSHRIILSYLFLFVIIITTSNWFTASEVIILRFFGILSLVGVAQLIYMQYSNYQLKTVPIYLSFLALAFMSQSLEQPSDSTLFQRKYFSVGAGFGFGQEEEVCGGINEYGAGGLSIEHTTQYKKFRKLYFGSQIYGLQYEDDFSFGINPYLGFSDRWFEGGIGVNYVNFYTAWRDEFLTPTIYLRLGPQDILFADFNYGGYMPSGIPTFQLGLGFGFRSNPENNVRFGIGSSGYYINPCFMLDNKMSMSPYLSYANQDLYHFGLRLNYRIFHE